MCFLQKKTKVRTMSTSVLAYHDLEHGRTDRGIRSHFTRQIRTGDLGTLTYMLTRVFHIRITALTKVTDKYLTF